MKPAAAIEILSVRIDCLTIPEAIEQICRRAGEAGSPAAMVTKPYVEFFSRAVREPVIRELLNSAWLSLPDGVAPQWAAHYLSGRGWGHLPATLAEIVLRPERLADIIPQRFNGSTFTWPLLEAAAARHLRVYLIGAPSHSTIEHTAEVIRRRLPAIQIVGTFDGYRVNTQAADCLADIRAQQADIILVGTGFPRQERFMAASLPQLHHGVLIGEGGTFDYRSFGGKLAKAPRFVSTVGLEWLWRLGRQPKRLGRQLAIPRFIWQVWLSRPRQTTKVLL